MKTFKKREPQTAQAFKWEGQEHENLLPSVYRGYSKCVKCGQSLQKEHALVKHDWLLVCPGDWVIFPEGTNIAQVMNEEEFFQKYMEAE